MGLCVMNVRKKSCAAIRPGVAIKAPLASWAIRRTGYRAKQQTGEDAFLFLGDSRRVSAAPATGATERPPAAVCARSRRGVPPDLRNRSAPGYPLRRMPINDRPSHLKRSSCDCFTAKTQRRQDPFFASWRLCGKSHGVSQQCCARHAYGSEIQLADPPTKPQGRPVVDGVIAVVVFPRRRSAP